MPYPIAEDEAIFGLMFETESADAGISVVKPFDTCKDATAWLESNTPDAAVLDLKLKDGPCTDVAAILVERGLPFVALTGAKLTDVPDVFQGAPVIEKPADLAKLPRVVEELVRSKVSGGK